METTIRFLKSNQYRKAIGDTDSQLGYGVHDALVRRGIAEFVASPLIAAGMSEPMASTDTPKRRQRRSETIEE